MPAGNTSNINIKSLHVPGKPHKIFQAFVFAILMFRLSLDNSKEVQNHEKVVPKFHVLTQLTCTCSKSTIKALEKGVNYVQS